MARGEIRASFHLLQRLVMDYPPYSTFMFDWIKQDFLNPIREQEVLKLLEEEYMYLVSSSSLEILHCLILIGFLD